MWTEPITEDQIAENREPPIEIEPMTDVNPPPALTPVGRPMTTANEVETPPADHRLDRVRKCRSPGVPRREPRCRAR